MKSNRKVVVKKGCHSRGMSGPQGSGISLIRLRKLVETFCLKTILQKGDPRQKPSGMTLKDCFAYARNDGRKGFTLIELLVVVLIIGILAAVAVPQYKFAVVKARVATILPLMKSIASAEEVYYLANGGYTTEAHALDVAIPAECSLTTEGNTNTWKCTNGFVIDISSTANRVIANYCPGVDDFVICQSKRDFQIVFEFQQDNEQAAQRWCRSFSDLGEKICKSLTLQ